MFKNLNLNCINIHNFTIPEGLELAKTYGYKGLDLDPIRLEKLVQQKSIEYVKALLTDTGIKPGGWWLPMTWSDTDTVYNEQLSNLPTFAKLYADLGCYRCCTGVQPGDNSRPFKEQFEFCVKRLRKPAEILKSYGHSLGFEFIGPATRRAAYKYHFIYTIDGMLAFASAIGTGNIGLLMDVYQAYTSHANLDDWKKLSKEDVIYVHLCDAPNGIDIEQQMDWSRELPGETGVIPLVEILHILKDVGYDGPVTPEPYNKKLEGIAPQEAARIVSEATDKVWREAGLA